MVRGGLCRHALVQSPNQVLEELACPTSIPNCRRAHHADAARSEITAAPRGRARPIRPVDAIRARHTVPAGVCRGPAAARDDVRHAGRHQLFVLLPPPPGRARQRVSDTHTVKKLAEDSIVHRPARECLDPRRRTRTDGRTDGPHLDRSPRLTAPAGRALHALGCLANWDAQGKLTYYCVVQVRRPSSYCMHAVWSKLKTGCCARLVGARPAGFALIPCRVSYK